MFKKRVRRHLPVELGPRHKMVVLAFALAGSRRPRGRGDRQANPWLQRQHGIDQTRFTRPRRRGDDQCITAHGISYSMFCTCSRSCRSEEHTSELQSLMRISYAVFCLKKKKKQ